MGDTIEVFKAMRDLRQERHAEWFEKNMAALRAAGFLARDRVELRPTAVLFREYGRPRVNFHPHTGRWLVLDGTRRTLSGGAAAFIAWYSKQKVGAPHAA